MRRSSIRLATIASLLFALPAAADWPAGGKRVAPAGYVVWGNRYAQLFDLPSGDLGLVAIGSTGNVTAYRAQRISRGGDIAPGWTTDGARLGETAPSGLEYGTAIDDSACFWMGGMMDTNPGNAVAAAVVRPDAVRLP